MLFNSKVKYYLNVCLTVIKFVKVSFCRSTSIQVKTVFNMSNHFAVTCLKMEFTFLEHCLEGTQGFMKNIFNGVSYLSSLEL